MPEITIFFASTSFKYNFLHELFLFYIHILRLSVIRNVWSVLYWFQNLFPWKFGHLAIEALELTYPSMGTNSIVCILIVYNRNMSIIQREVEANTRKYVRVFQLNL